MPELKGKLDGMSMRVPTPDGSVVDLVGRAREPTTKEEINAAMKAAAEGPMKGILEYTEDPSSRSTSSATPLSVVRRADDHGHGRQGTFVKCFSWYDNEWGYSNRVKDLAKKMMA